VSIVSVTGGVSELSISALRFAGNVFERCMGARLLRLVTLAGKSLSIGDGDFSQIVGMAAGLICSRTGDDESRSIVVVPLDSVGGAATVSCGFARARDGLELGLVTFAKLCIPT
jgi:hypothetical protein